MPRPAERPSPDLRPLLGGAPAPFDALGPAAREALLTAAVRHGLLGAVAGRLPADDPELRRRFERLAAGARLRDARLRQALAEVLALLGTAGVVPVALKGPVLADRLYPDPALRASTDLDLLVPEGVLLRAAQALAPAGFRRGPPLQEAYQLRHHHHLHLSRDGGPDVELHFRPVSAFGSAVPAAELRARARPCRIGEREVLVLAPEDELVVLAVHAAAHLLERAGWLLDLKLLLGRSPGLDWGAVAARAEAWRCRRPLAYALAHLRSLGVAVPDASLLALGAHRRRLVDRLAPGALARGGRVGGVLRMGVQFLLRDRLGGVAGHLLHEAAWVVRRRTHLLARRLTHPRGRRSDVGPPPNSQNPGDTA